MTQEVTALYDVEIMMSTFNGEKYLREQLDSILRQTVKQIHLLIWDDGSTDGTMHILKEYEEKYSNVTVLGSRHLGYPQGFFHLMERAGKAKYYAFADQDDYWMPEKLAAAISKIKESYHAEKPVLYCSRKTVTDSELHPLKWQDTPPITGLGNVLLRMNQASGCTMVYNLKMQELLAKYIPKAAPYHDSWIYKIAYLLGHIIYDTNSYILYRQHNDNVDGAHLRGLSLLKSKLKNFDFTFKRYRKREPSPYIGEIVQGYGRYCQKKDRQLMENILNIRKSYIARWKVLWQADVSLHPFYEYIWIKLKIVLGWL